jgi:hypothetical protein
MRYIAVGAVAAGLGWYVRGWVEDVRREQASAHADAEWAEKIARHGH